MSKRKRTASHPRTPKKRKFNAPRIINSQKWKDVSPKKCSWKCVECNTFNLQKYVFCSKCAAEPPMPTNAPSKAIHPYKKKKQIGFKPIKLALLDRTMNENTNTNTNSHNRNIKTANDLNKGSDCGYPDFQIQFSHISSPSAQRYAKYLEKNIRREQSYHISQFNEYLKRLHDTLTNDYNEFSKQFVWKINAITRNSEHQKIVNLTSSNHKCHLGEYSVGTPVLVLCQCQFDTITDINQYFLRAVQGMIEETPKPTNGSKVKVAVIKDNQKTLKNYSNNSENKSADNDTIPLFLFDFEHDTPNCQWILCVNNLSYYAKQLKHLDIFVNATKYQFPHKLFDYIYACDIAWMALQNETNDLLFADHISQTQNLSLNDSQQSSIAKALIHPVSLIQGPPGTGKTYTLAHLCQFIIDKKYKSEDEIIVVTAHSHSACDQILNALSLIIRNDNRITRMGSINKISPHLKRYAFKKLLRKRGGYTEYLRLKKSGLKENAMECLKKCSRNLLMDEIDIVICTCYGCSSPYLMGVDVSVRYLMIDESTQIVESELLIAINLLRDRRDSHRGRGNGNGNGIMKYYSAIPPPMESEESESGMEWEDFNKRIVMIGDPRQLGPVVRSTEAVQCGGSISMFERLLGLHSVQSINDMVRRVERERRREERQRQNKSNSQKESDIIMKRCGFATCSEALKKGGEFKENEKKMQRLMNDKKEKQQLFQQLNLQKMCDNKKEGKVTNYTLLNVQYRMKQFLMKFCNDTFYDSCIKTHMSPESERKCVINGIDWTDRDKSVAFMSLDYSQQIRTNGLSYYNNEECEYINGLISDVILRNKGGMFEIREKDIGIIAMHRAQVSRMKQVLGMNKTVSAKDIEVKTVDGFQGKEKKLIILSFVRTDNTSTSFLANAQRCNVALTRAKYGLVIVGQLQQLKANSMWRQFAKFVEKHNVVRVVNYQSSQ